MGSRWLQQGARQAASSWEALQKLLGTRTHRVHVCESLQLNQPQQLKMKTVLRFLIKSGAPLSHGGTE